MTGSKNYQIKRLPKFETTLKSLIEKHYKKDEKARNKFLSDINDLIQEASVNPLKVTSSRSENFPKGSYKEDFLFMKKRWNLPGLSGAARKGRIIYIVDTIKKIVYLLWAYTHEEFTERPPDRELAKEIKETLT